jgi:hypothetical protein
MYLTAGPIVLTLPERRPNCAYLTSAPAQLCGRPLPAKHGRKVLPCPTCRAACAVKGGRAAELPIVYLALQ